MVKMTSSVAIQRIADVPDDKLFWCRDGRTMRNLRELAAALEQMSDETYRFHANDVKTDFANWVRDVIGDDKLTRDLLKGPDRAQAAGAVAERLAWLKGKAGSA